MPTWLYENLNDSVLVGYWTSSPRADDDYKALGVVSGGHIANVVSTNNDSVLGLRPVITIFKSNLG